MTRELPPPIERYFTAKNAHDFAAAASAFAESAVVEDEGHSHKGPTAIRSWMGETSKKYDDTAEVLDVKAAGDAVVVTARVSGTFPGSPAALHFRFTLAGDRIARLEIGA